MSKKHYTARALAGASTDRQRASIEALVETQSSSKAAKILGRDQANIARDYRIAENRIEVEEFDAEESKIPCAAAELLEHHARKDVARYVIVSAQNATPLHRGFYASILKYCEERDARLIVIPYRYMNPTSLFSQGARDAELWAPELAQYMLSSDVDLNENLMLAGSIKVRPTAQQPLSGMQAYSKSKSMILGHPKVQWKTIPTMQGEMPKILTSTGSITTRNYTDTKSGRLGEFGHVIGGLVVETRGNQFQIRQINADSGGAFTDIDRHYTPMGSYPAERPEMLTCGDVHHAQLDTEADHATFGPGGLVDRLRPKRLAVHDLLDFRARNHHDAGDIFLESEKSRTGSDDVEKEVRNTLAWLEKRAQLFDETYVVESNHNEALVRWLREGRGANDPKNAHFYHRTMSALLTDSDGHREATHALEFWYYKWYPNCQENVTFLRRNTMLRIGGIEHSMHGDVGPNGARGSTKSFDQLGVKSTSGHCHGPEIFGGVWRAGVMGTHKMGFNERGPGNWLTTHVVQYATGARSFFTLLDGEFWIE